jgi:hypothetical protein
MNEEGETMEALVYAALLGLLLFIALTALSARPTNPPTVIVMTDLPPASGGFLLPLLLGLFALIFASLTVVLPR